jgi:molybdenum-dependent DNA-binding transcriptional regulator ModE
MNNMMRPRAIDPDLLRTFHCITETGSFSRTAEMVGRSQSAVSMQVQRLEALLGKSLLVRSTSGEIRLTVHGSRLLSRAKEMLAINDAIWADYHRPEAYDQTMPADFALPLQAQREAFTSQLLMTLLTNEKFSAAYALIMRHVENKATVDPIKLDSNEDDLYMALLSMLEYMSINFLSNTLDREILLRQRRSGLLRAYETLANYIEYKRNAWNRPNAYRSFEMVVTHYILENDKSSQQRAVAHSAVTSC